MELNKFKAGLTIVISAMMALYLGVAVATEQEMAILWVAGLLAVTFILALGKNVWLLIAAGSGLSGGLNFLPGSPKVWWIGMMATGCVFMVRFLMRRRGEFTWRWSLLDFVMLIHIVMLAQAWIRNPVGFQVLGASQDGMIGGKPYALHAFAIISYVLLSMVPANLKMVKIAVIVMITCAFFDGAASLAGSFFPGLAAVGVSVYSGFSFNVAQSGIVADASTSRVSEGKQVGEDLGRAAFTLFRPITTLNPWNLLRFSMMVMAVGSTLISGYRSSMGLLVIFFVVGSLIRGKLRDVVAMAMLSLVGLCALMFVGTERLPHGAQRILSVLPISGLVDERIKESAGNSTDWRVEMWILALTTDRYIHNKAIGDGFGMRKDEMDASIAQVQGDGRFAAGMDMQEAMMARGSYHGFHVQTIRITGYVGLVAAMFMLGVFCKHAWSHIKYFRGRPEWGYVLYICVPFLIYPFYAMLVFADYRFGLCDYLLLAGFLKMLWNVRHAEAKDRALEVRDAPKWVSARKGGRTRISVRGMPEPLGCFHRGM